MRVNKESDSVLIQTTVSKPLQGWLQRSAKREGLSLAAFVRRMLLASHAQRQPLRPDVRVQVLPDNIFPKKKAAGKKSKTNKKKSPKRVPKKAAKKAKPKTVKRKAVSKKQTELAL